MMDLLSLISGATSKIGSEMAGFENAMTNAYNDSPFGALEDSFKNSGVHQAFSAGRNQYGGHGGGMSHATLDQSQPDFVSATNSMQNIMSQAGIMNPSASQLTGGSAPNYMPLPTLRRNPEPIYQAPRPYGQDNLDELDELEKNAGQKVGMLYEPMSMSTPTTLMA
tara:strand:+ start:139 stop:636 length:498 start_codon:yes stop_codon:yes gene_type:complete